MTKTETIMWCIAYALGRNPCVAEIRRAKAELLSVDPKSVNKVIKSTKLLLPHMTEQEISLFQWQICSCMLSAVSYRVSLRVCESTTLGYCICPRCRRPLGRDYQAYCDRCGQHLAW